MQDSVLPRGVGLRKPHISPSISPSIFPHIFPTLAVLFAVLLLVYFVYFVVSISTCCLFPCVLWFLSHMQCCGVTFFIMVLRKRLTRGVELWYIFGSLQILNFDSLQIFWISLNDERNRYHEDDLATFED